jgi:hypothetical protein
MFQRSFETGFGDIDLPERDSNLALLHGDPEFQKIIEAPPAVGLEPLTASLKALEVAPHRRAPVPDRQRFRQQPLFPG